MVSVGKLRGTHLLPCQPETGDRLGIHTYKIVQLVATVYVESLTARSETVRSIDVATVTLIEIQTPVVMIVIPIFKFKL